MTDGPERRAVRARTITIRKARFGAEDERLDREFWAKLTPDERILETWRLSVELWEMKGWDPGKSGRSQS